MRETKNLKCAVRNLLSNKLRQECQHQQEDKVNDHKAIDLFPHEVFPTLQIATTMNHEQGYKNRPDHLKIAFYWATTHHITKISSTCFFESIAHPIRLWFSTPNNVTHNVNEFNATYWSAVYFTVNRLAVVPSKFWAVDLVEPKEDQAAQRHRIQSDCPERTENALLTFSNWNLWEDFTFLSWIARRHQETLEKVRTSEQQRESTKRCHHTQKRYLSMVR